MAHNNRRSVVRNLVQAVVGLLLSNAPIFAAQGDDSAALLDSGSAGMRIVSGYHVEETLSDDKGQTNISGDIAGDDYDITVNSTARTCKVKGKYWSSQDNGQHWQAGIPDDEIFNFLKSTLKITHRMEGGETIDKSRYVRLQRMVADDKTVTCIEVWLGPLSASLPNPLPDQADMPHYWIAETKDGQTWIEHVQRNETFRSVTVHVDAKFTKIDEISMITPPGADTGRAPYVVTTPTPDVVVIKVPGKKDQTPAAPEKASQIHGRNSPQGPARENSLGMKFVPAGTPGVLFCIWDVRVRDFRAFVNATGYQVEMKHGTTPSFAQTENDPVVRVTWHDAKAFCAWLTRKERAENKIGSDEHYRLPTDFEWSVAVGLKESSEGFPLDKDSKTEGVYPWGTQWPPPNGAGNYDETLTHDGYVHTSPVGSFPATRYGLYDMGGNVAQWCEDVFGNDPVSVSYRTSRGGSYNADTASWCLASYRGNGNAGIGESTGFRVVLANRSETSLPEYSETIERSLEAFFALMWGSEDSQDAAYWASNFAPTSQYCNKDDGPASRDYIQSDRAKLIESWPDRTYTLVGNAVYVISPDTSSARITFRYSYVYSRESEKMNGAADTTINVEMSSNGDWLITQYNETIKRN